MIKGIGTDIIEVERIASKIQKENGFRELVFSAEEIKYCEAKTNKYEHYAARFAAKEALGKALGLGWAEGTTINEVEIRNNAEGKPYINFLGETAKKIASLNLGNIHVSLSHIKTFATAIVIIEQQHGS
ncbi:holo-[acyl-carrier-protein] synthase [Panacibacter ginsenosidivorans]|uniref:Holo-[acyl-carrier-protein] synthase n=1 Tax=Panacibacter ginsenosidivorans TaxID=1813871 RepID=A0A5B8VE15_9BACT|nr:holo-ACP synthase [Panacibacter ginsenosidivorans]QEC69757.1 holo-[acyl-carrier-protein] synthase [Panacibacter ginsenosidivorans]